MKDPFMRKTKTFALRASGLEGNTIRGVASVAGVMDSYADVILPGAFSESVLSEFLSTGFVAAGHDWTSYIAMPLVAQNQGVNLYTEAEFHSTEDAQSIRTKCQERIARGLAVGLSVGFSMSGENYRAFTSGAALLEYAKAAGYDLADFDEAGIRAYTSRCQAILAIDRLYEYSIVGAPANPSAWATEVKDMPKTGTAPLLRGQYLGPWAAAEAAYSALYSLVSDLMWGPIYDSLYGWGDLADMDAAGRLDYLRGGLDEFSATVLAIAEALLPLIVMDAPAQDAEDDLTMYDAAGSGRDDPQNPLRQFLLTYFPPLAEGAPAASAAAQAESVRAAVEALLARMQAIHALRQKEGRTLSASGRETLSQIAEGLSASQSAILALTQTAQTHAPATEPEASSPEARRIQLLRIAHRRRMARLERDGFAPNDMPRTVAPNDMPECAPA